jgi:hypothetical protein
MDVQGSTGDRPEEEAGLALRGRRAGSLWPARSMWLLPLVILALVLLVVLGEPALVARGMLLVASILALCACFLGPLAIADCRLVAERSGTRVPRARRSV